MCVCRGSVSDVWVKGEQLLKGRELTTIDEAVCVTRESSSIPFAPGRAQCTRSSKHARTQTLTHARQLRHTGRHQAGDGVGTEDHGRQERILGRAGMSSTVTTMHPGVIAPWASLC